MYEIYYLQRIDDILIVWRIMDKIAVLIPCYNEEKTIAKVIADTKSSLPESVIYVYNNNSTDRTEEIARAASCPRRSGSSAWSPASATASSATG